MFKKLSELQKATIFCFEGKGHVSASRVLGVFLLLSIVPSCSLPNNSFNQLEESSVNYSSIFLGGIAVDEPRAALVGRDILLAGGSAIDAAVGAYFALSVTKPSAASLGGGGICLVRDSKSQIVETLDFRSMLPRIETKSVKTTVGIPGNAFGFFALHAKYGSLPWRQLIQPAENLARFGFKVSRSLSQDLYMAEKILSRGEDVKKIFFREDSLNILREGDFIKQTELSAMLSVIRSKGAAELYHGPTAKQFLEAIQNSGGRLQYQDLRNFRPKWSRTIEIPFIHNTSLHFPSVPRSVGIRNAQVIGMLMFDNFFADGDQGERAHLVAEALERSLSNSNRWRGLSETSIDNARFVAGDYIKTLISSFEPQRRVITPGAEKAELDPTSQSSGVSLATMDASGSAVACSLSMGRPFGIGRMARGTGIFLSNVPRGRSRDQSLAAIILDNRLGKNVYYASAASGGATAASSIVNVAIDALVRENSNLKESIATKRIHHGGADGITYIEKGISRSILEGLAERGHKLAYVNSMGLVNAIFCKAGIPRKNPEDIECVTAADPRGYGLSDSIN